MFLLAAEQHGLASLGLPYAGYLHTLPRVIALAATSLDPILQPAAYLVAALAVTLAVCGSLLSPRLDLPNQLLLALAVVAVPHSGEVFFNPTNLQWIVALGILATTLKRDPLGASDWCVDLGFLIVGGLTGPMILFAWPILLARAGRRRSRVSLIFFLIGTAVATLQLSFILRLEPESTAPLNVFALCASVGLHLFCETFFGFLVTPAPPKIAALLASALISGLVGVVIATSDRYRPALLSMLAFSIFVLGATSILKRVDAWAYGEVPLGDRYFYIPKTILIWILGIGTVAATRRWVRQGATALLVLAVVCNAPRFQFVPHPDLGWQAACPRIRAGEGLVITINPDWKFYYRRGSSDSRLLSRREVESLERK